jgi:histidine triad (HIT) family protein
MAQTVPCLFCRIIAREVHGDIVYEDERAVVFRDLNPQAPVHLLVVPRKHISSLGEAASEDEQLLGHLLRVGADLIRKEGLLERGYRTVVNTNREAGQTVFHIHVHILGGRPLGWPPG